MVTACMAISGEWRRSKDCSWEFVDTDRLSRVIAIPEGSSLKELKLNVAKEFGFKGGGDSTISLSYWPVKVDGFTINTKTPPVMLTNDAAVAYFITELNARNAKNLFVRFTTNTKSQTQTREEEDGVGYITPVGGKTKVMGFDLNTVASPAENHIIDIPTVGSKSGPDWIDDDELLSWLYDEEIRDLRSSSKSGQTSKSAWVLGIDSDESEDDEDVVDITPSNPGYDMEFWEPLLAEEHGGSNAEEIMLVGKDSSSNTTGGIDAADGTVHVDQVARATTNKAINIDTHGQVHAAHSTSSDFEYYEDPNLQRVAPERRNLGDIDDEEFDIPPMFDDTKYQIAEIPDLDKIEDDGVVAVGKVFRCREDLQITLALFAIKNMFHYLQSRTRTNYVVFNCSDRRCDWRVTAREMKYCGYYKIMKCYLVHTCSIETRNRYREKVTSKVIAAVYKSKFGTPGAGPLAMDLQQLVLEDLRVNISYMKGYRAKDKANSLLWGTEEESYEKLPAYLHLLKATNPGTVTEIKTVTDEGGVERFKYVFLSFGASIKGFKMLRRVLIVDGTHLTGKYKGVLLTASGQDANFQVFPLAYAVVDTENDASWIWFMKIVESIVGDGEDLTIISDRCQYIYKAKAEAFPRSNHAACVVHLERNIISRFKSKGLAKFMTEAAYAYKVGEFNAMFSKIKHENMNLANYLEKIGIRHWSRAYFKGNQYNLMTSNIAESLNNALRKGRRSPIVELLRFIQAMMTRWFSARRKKSVKHRGGVPIEVEKVMTKNKVNFVGSKVSRISCCTFEVIGPLGGRTTVSLDTMRCNCRAYDLLQVPCGHALVAADFAGISYPKLVPLVFKTSSWVTTYEGVIHPEADGMNELVPKELDTKKIIPPKVNRPPGRERVGRIPSQGEIMDKNIEHKPAPNRCGRCRGVGHNRSTCKNPI